MPQPELPDPNNNPTIFNRTIWPDWHQISFVDMPRQYLHHVHSQPTKVSDSIWKQWYSEARSRDMVYFEVSSTAAFYERLTEDSMYLDIPTDGINEMQYLAVYQMGRTIPRYMDEYQKNVRIKSHLWDDSLTCFNVAKFHSDHLDLVEILGSYEHNETVAPYIIHTRIIGEEVEAKLQFEHVNAASKLDGYRRSLLYRPLDHKDSIPYVILIHEFETEPGDLSSVKTEMEAIGPSQDCGFQLRSFKLLDSEGFDGECRVPERLQ